MANVIAAVAATAVPGRIPRYRSSSHTVGPFQGRQIAATAQQYLQQRCSLRRQTLPDSRRESSKRCGRRLKGGRTTLSGHLRKKEP